MAQIDTLTNVGAVVSTDLALILRGGANVLGTFGSLVGQNATSVTITGGTINGTVIGGTTAAAGSFTTGAFSGDIDTSGLLKVGANDTEYANNYIRFKPTGTSYIDHSAVGQNINFRLSNASSLDKTPLVVSPLGIDVTGTVTADGLTVGIGDYLILDGGSAGEVIRTPVAGTLTLESRGSVDIYGDSNNNGASTSDVFRVLRDSTYIGGTAKVSLKVDDSGDISFYEDTGTTAKFFWDASAESLGIGTSSPITKLNTSSGVLRTNTAKTYTSFQSSTDFDDFRFGLATAIKGGATGADRYVSLDSAIYTVSTGSFGIGSSLVLQELGGNVGIGDSTFAAGKLQVYDSSGNHVWLKGRASDGTSSVSFRNNADNTYNGRIQVADTGGMLFQVAGSTRATIDASGNLLVGTTTPFVGGVTISPLGVVQAERNNVTGVFNRTSTDGEIIQFRKDGTTVGSIGTAFGQLTIGNGGSGLMFVDAAPDRVLPSTSTGAAADGLIDLGDNDDRFKDLYLSGGVYLGGAGAANLLDDYEEGTWTPTDQSGAGLTLTVNSASYTKIGRLCYVYAYVTYPSNTNGAGSGIGGLPFQALSGNTYAQLSVRVTSDTVSANNLTFQVAAASSLGNVHNGASIVLNSALSTNSVLISGFYTVA